VKALVVGAGRVGSAVARALDADGWDVTVVDEREESLTLLGESWKGGFVLGHGIDTAVLEQAGIAEADVFVASTNGDNTNIVVAQIAKQRYEVPSVAARILDPYRAQFFSNRGFDVVSPTSTAIAELTGWAFSQDGR
jgi:trk system potassium uptake protein TrkA